MNKKKKIYKYKNSKYNKSLQKIKKNRIIDQKTIQIYKKQQLKLNNKDSASSDEDTVPTAKRNVIIKPDPVVISRVDSSDFLEESEATENLNPPPGGKKLSKWKRIKSEFEKEKNEKIEGIKKSKKIKRNKRKNRIRATKLLTSTNKKGQPVMKDVMKHLLNKINEN